MYHAERGLAPFSIRTHLGAKIENNSEWNFKDLEEMMGSAKTLKRHGGECEGNPYWPLVYSVPKIFRRFFFAVGRLMSVRA